jgi:hypothetical protein
MIVIYFILKASNIFVTTDGIYKLGLLLIVAIILYLQEITSQLELLMKVENKNSVYIINIIFLMFLI